METKIKIGIITKLPLKTEEEVTAFVEKLHETGFFIDKDDTKYFTRKIDESWYLEYVSDDSKSDTETNTTTLTFDPIKIIDECKQLENLLEGDVSSKAYVFVGNFEPYDTIINEGVEN